MALFFDLGLHFARPSVAMWRTRPYTSSHVSSFPLESFVRGAAVLSTLWLRHGTAPPIAPRSIRSSPGSFPFPHRATRLWKGGNRSLRGPPRPLPIPMEPALSKRQRRDGTDSYGGRSQMVEHVYERRPGWTKKYVCRKCIQCNW
jgi:hypothetical protein